MLAPTPAATIPTLAVERGGRRLRVDPATLVAALHHLDARPLAADHRGAQGAGDARLRSAGILVDDLLVPWAARILGPIAQHQTTLQLEIFERAEVTGFQLWLEGPKAALAERGADGVLTLSAIQSPHLAATVADLVGLEDSSELPSGETVTVEQRLLERFLARLAAGDTPRAGALLAGRPVALQALRVLLALADGRARWWRIEDVTDRGSERAGPELQVIDALGAGLWCSGPETGPPSSELVLVPAQPGHILDRLQARLGSCAGITRAA